MTIPWKTQEDINIVWQERNCLLKAGYSVRPSSATNVKSNSYSSSDLNNKENSDLVQLLVEESWFRIGSIATLLIAENKVEGWFDFSISLRS